MTVWLVEDDEDIRELVAYSLRAAGFEARPFERAAPFFDALRTGRPDLVLLDIMLPGEDGLSVLKKLRAAEKTRALPVILLTARGEEYDKVLGLDAGADDYVSKPFGVMELVSRVKAVLRRGGVSLPEGRPAQLRSGALVLNIEKHFVAVDGVPVTLTLKEFELLRLLMENPGVVMTRDTLLDRVWDTLYEGGTRTVDVHVRSLRQKLGIAADLVETVRGVGYRLGETE